MAIKCFYSTKIMWKRKPSQYSINNLYLQQLCMLTKDQQSKLLIVETFSRNQIFVDSLRFRLEETWECTLSMEEWRLHAGDEGRLWLATTDETDTLYSMTGQLIYLWSRSKRTCRSGRLTDWWSWDPDGRSWSPVRPGLTDATCSVTHDAHNIRHATL